VEIRSGTAPVFCALPLSNMNCSCVLCPPPSSPVYRRALASPQPQCWWATWCISCHNIYTFVYSVFSYIIYGSMLYKAAGENREFSLYPACPSQNLTFPKSPSTPTFFLPSLLYVLFSWIVGVWDLNPGYVLSNLVVKACTRACTVNQLFAVSRH
jgi:hypothetical protein